MTNPDPLFAISIALSFVAGIAFAVLLAVLLHRGAREIAEKQEAEDESAQRS